MTRRRWVAAGVGVLILVIAVIGVLVWREVTRVHVCDAWSMELRDGTILYAPWYDEVSGGEQFGQCWTLPAGVTTGDLR